MADVLTPVLTDTWDAEQGWKLATYAARGGYAALDTAFAMSPDDVITAAAAAQTAVLDGGDDVVRAHRERGVEGVVPAPGGVGGELPALLGVPGVGEHRGQQAVVG